MMNEQVPQPATPDDVRWQLSYDRASVDAFLAEVEIERARLQRDIEAARARTEASGRLVEGRGTDALAELGALVVAARTQLTRIEDEHAAIVETIRRASATEAARVLAAAHREVEAMRASTASLARLVHDPSPAAGTTDAD